ncbi:MAG: small metal-binding protein SmbP [Methylocystis sp.]|nr:small metal-binding protein SmbP [Methylocystis sp.]
MEEETNMLTRRLMVALVASALGLTVAPRMAQAQDTHLEQAITETKEAIQEGKQDLPASLVEHAVNAIDHVRAAQKEKQSEHLKSGVTHLKKAIKWAKHTHSSRRVAKAVKEAETALTHLEAAK